MKLKSKNLLTNTIIYFSFAIISLVFLFPLLWIVSLSLKNVKSLFTYPPVFIPEIFHFENYRMVMLKSDLAVYLFNSVKIVFFTVLGTLAISIPAAFGFSRFRFKFKDSLQFGILAFQMISPLIISIPLYRYFNSLGITNQHWSIILVYIAIEIPFQTWFLKSFIDSIPISLDEAAEIDGCTRFQTLRKVILPLTAPGIASATIFAAIHAWSQFIIPLVLLNDNKLMPVSVGILNYQSTTEVISTHYLAAASIISIFPAIFLFVFMQRFIVGAMTAGAVKG